MDDGWNDTELVAVSTTGCARKRGLNYQMKIVTNDHRDHSNIVITLRTINYNTESNNY